MTLNSNLPKKRGRPLGSKNKRRVAKKVAPKEKSFKQDDKEKLAIKTLVEGLVDEINRQRTIISYLEDKLESK